jgi:hypothetical protein
LSGDESLRWCRRVLVAGNQFDRLSKESKWIFSRLNLNFKHLQNQLKIKVQRKLNPKKNKTI